LGAWSTKRVAESSVGGVVDVKDSVGNKKGCGEISYVGHEITTFLGQ
jgi:hypothetical protein